MELSSLSRCHLLDVINVGTVVNSGIVSPPVSGTYTAILSFQHQQRCFGRAKGLLPDRGKIHLNWGSFGCRNMPEEKALADILLANIVQYFLSPAQEGSCQLVCCAKESNCQGWRVKELLMQCAVDIRRVAPDFPFESLFPQMRAIDFKVKKILYFSRGDKMETGIRLKAERPLSLRVLPERRYIDFAFQFPFSVEPVERNAGNRLRQQVCSDQDISNHNGMLDKITIVSFVLFIAPADAFGWDATEVR